MASSPPDPRPAEPPVGCTYVLADRPGQVIGAADAAACGEALREGATVLVISSMKMEFCVAAPVGGVLREVLVAPGTHVEEGQPIALPVGAIVVMQGVGGGVDAALDELRLDRTALSERAERKGKAGEEKVFAAGGRGGGRTLLDRRRLGKGDAGER